MRRRGTRLVQLLLVALMVLPFLLAARPRWAVYYGSDIGAGELRGYDLVVLDSDRHPSLPAHAHGQIFLGYLSLGEIAESRPYFSAVAGQPGVLIGSNPKWPGSHFADLRDTRWRSRVLNELVPAILAEGFDGVFLDTLDDPVELERRDPDEYRGMTGAAADLLKTLKRSFPNIVIMMNRGYSLLPEVAKSIDILLGESVFSTHDPGGGRYHLAPPAAYREQVRLLQGALRLNPHLKICSLDYWDPADRDGIRRVYREERGNGFAPYVATAGLDELIKEPR